MELKIVIAVIALALAFISIKLLNKKAREEGYCESDIDYLYGRRFTIYKSENFFYIYDSEFHQDISVYDKRMSFDSHEEAEEFLLEYGDLFAMFEDEE